MKENHLYVTTIHKTQTPRVLSHVSKNTFHNIFVPSNEEVKILYTKQKKEVPYI